MYAEAHQIQNCRSQIYLLDLRNHGRSGRSTSMNYLQQAEDLNRFLEENEIDDKVTLVGHSLGGKVAMAFSLLYPEKTAGLCSIDSPPVNRNLFPSMNRATEELMQRAVEILPDLERMTYK